MVFSSPTFLFAFLPATLLVYLAVPARARNSWLLAASVLFYVWGSGGQVAVLLYVGLVSFGGARLARGRRAAIAGIVGLLLAPIALYKYAPPATDLVRSTLWSGAPPAHWALPLGISFFTFHAISYVVDVARGLPPERNLRDYLLYLFLFPHQIAGPIVRYAQIAGELKGRRDVTLDDASFGLSRFAWGLAKKAFVADSAGLVADAAFSAPSGTLNATTAWIGAIAYAVQIYFDFSGYSDMAIGLAAMLGFRFPENFLAPYRSLGPADFWQRWHMTLSGWFRDYVYIPLGGNRHGPRREYTALLATFFLTALWHGATWPFLVWGGLHSGALLLERATGQRGRTTWPGLRRAVMALFIVISWVPFRSPTLGHAVEIWRAMAGAPGEPTGLGGLSGSTGLSGSSWLGGLSGASGLGARLGAPSPEVLITLTPWTLLALAVGLLVFVGPRHVSGFQFVHAARPQPGDRRDFRPPRAAVTVPVLLVIAVVSVLWLDFSPFLYFQF
jgi:alginate O-acetyltransferase complex protein AlgI